MQTQLVLFDYSQLDAPTRDFVEKRTAEIRTLGRRMTMDIIGIGQRLIEIKDRVGHGNWGNWLGYEFKWTERMARRFMNVARAFKSDKLSDLTIQASALYLLAAPATTDEARQEAIERAQEGEEITYTIAREIVDEREPEEQEQEEEEMPISEPERFVCKKCGEVFANEVWHCTHCHSHWSLQYSRCPECDRKAGTSGASQQVQVTIFSHESEEYYTPARYVEAAREVMGVIDLDPASCERAQEWIGAETFYTVADDGLKRRWLGRIWLNPPYSKTGNRSNQDIWSAQLIEQYRAGNVTEAILLVKSAMGYKWFENLWCSWPTCFARKRISFIRSNGDDKGQSKMGTAFLYLGQNVERFVEVFRQFGRVILPEERAHDGFAL